MPTLQALADALRINQTVTYVDLSENNFCDEGLKARARGGHGWGGCGTVRFSRETESDVEVCDIGHFPAADCSAAELLYEA